MPRIEMIAVFLFFPSLVSLFSLWSAYHSIYRIKKSKTTLKKLGKSIKLCHKLLLRYPLDFESPHWRKAIILQRLYYLILIIFLVCILLFAITILFPPAIIVLCCCVATKFIALDVPVGVFSFFATKHGKNGGVVWVWEDE